MLFSKYAFTYPVSKPTVVNTAKFNIDILTRNAYQPIFWVPGKGSTFVSNVIYETAEALIIKQSPVTTNTAQTNSVREKTHAAKKRH